MEVRQVMPDVPEACSAQTWREGFTKDLLFRTTLTNRGFIEQP